jgi:hypothetical protein
MGKRFLLDESLMARGLSFGEWLLSYSFHRTENSAWVTV